MLRSALAAVLLVGLGGCGRQDSAGSGSNTSDPGVSAQVTTGEGIVIDQANALKPDERNRISERLASINEAGGPHLTLVLLGGTGKDSMEQVGHAVSGQGKRRTNLLLVDVEGRRVRIESDGDIAAEAAAAVARTMEPGLRQGRVAEAVLAGLTVMPQSVGRT